MKRRILSLLLSVAVMFTFVGCGKGEVADSSSDASSTVSEAEKVETNINPLTGLSMNKSASGKRPVAVMINNISVAQSIQAGLSEADIVYELYAEGGITRFLAIFKDAENMPRIGSIRSARYSHIDLALAHDAIYVHAGKNETQAAPHLKALGVDNFDLNSGSTSKYGYRVQNGKASEHTLYTDGKKLSQGFSDLNWRTDLNTAETPWQSFVKEGSEITPNGGACSSLSVKMSGSYISNFKYDTESKKYVRSNGNTQQKDYNTGKSVSFKNVLVLKTTVTPFANDSTGVVKTHLDGGEGYYVTNGGYVPIKWKKGDAKNPLTITNEDGSTVDYNPGNTFVCLVDKNNSVTISAE